MTVTESLTWAEAIAHAHQHQEGFVLATVLEAKGSTPRDRGAKMVVTRSQTFDTLGGGRLEQLVIESARASLVLNVKAQHLEHFPLAG
jgi:xanthine dehydrogenase accessory factor